MYLKTMRVVNDGPIESLHIDLDPPKIVIFVGRNGSGKSTALSIVADAFFEFAATAYTDVLPQQGINRSWFRKLGGPLIRRGQSGGYAALQFVHEGSDFIYFSKSGKYSAEKAKEGLPIEVSSALSWEENDTVKSVTINSSQAEKILPKSPILYFPPDRREMPYWMNSDAVRLPDLEGPTMRLQGILDRDIYIPSSLTRISSWIAAVLMDSRIPGHVLDDQSIVGFSDKHASLLSSNIDLLNGLNRILKLILGDEGAQFIWIGRNVSPSLQYIQSGTPHPLSSLSSGQATLLSIFANVLRWGDGQPMATIQGICVVDEIDAHLHLSLQAHALSKLIELFPGMQFIFSAHSPLLLFALDRAFPGNTKILDMGTNEIASIEAYSEFSEAFELIRETQMFKTEILSSAAISENPLVLTEGQTDPDYLKCAIDLLGRAPEFEDIDITWVGSVTGGGSRGSGEKSLAKASQVLRENPSLTRREVVFLFDSDTRRSPGDFGNIHERVLPANKSNEEVPGGIENLLDKSAIGPEFYRKLERRNNDGGLQSTHVLQKRDACDAVCRRRRTSDFANFGAALDMILEALGRTPDRNSSARASDSSD